MWVVFVFNRINCLWVLCVRGGLSCGTRTPNSGRSQQHALQILPFSCDSCMHRCFCLPTGIGRRRGDGRIHREVRYIYRKFTRTPVYLAVFIRCVPFYVVRCTIELDHFYLQASAFRADTSLQRICLAFTEAGSVEHFEPLSAASCRGMSTVRPRPSQHLY